ncbi:proteobacterial dedicated sortase system response regulator [Oceanicoccus sp. KOV_DT_Chl]|uniref:proteobacterial dedicated sortase system response regulator n=1 Tax=Oceanicoccus sp. KOV_DT_Chl TaxID=1904639 RepID=UPI000C79BBDE|nr:proteobacterial dedicated sortase system response regulator [Oceanicoccus sp. KOV_DT_Chl]
MPKHIAIVEDEIHIAQNYRDAFEQQGYSVSIYPNRAAAMAGFAHKLPDLAVIDVGLEDEIEGGFELCRDLRSRSKTLPIVFLTARENEFDKISGLRLGADDYLTKDIGLHHMLARIVALFRRVDALGNPTLAEEVINTGDLSINIEQMRIQWQQQALDITVTEFWIIHTLARHPGQVKSREQLMEAAKVVLDDNTITSHIKRIRKKFQSIDDQFCAINTAYGLGYRWQVQ